MDHPSSNLGVSLGNFRNPLMLKVLVINHLLLGVTALIHRGHASLRGLSSRCLFTHLFLRRIAFDLICELPLLLHDVLQCISLALDHCNEVLNLSVCKLDIGLNLLILENKLTSRYHVCRMS